MCFRFRSFPFHSTFFRPSLFRFWLLGLCFFLSSFFPSSPHNCLSSASFRFRFFDSPCSSRPSFPCLLSQFFVLGFLFVSFRSSLIRSHSCSSGAYLMLSLSVLFPSVPFPFVLFPSGSSYSAFCFFLSSFFPASSHSHSSGAASPYFYFLAFSTSAPPGFPCFAFVFEYSAFCSFPFIPLGFAPTAVPPMLPLLSL